MAYSLESSTVSIVIMDESGNRAAKVLKVTGATPADVITNAQTLATDLAPLTDGGLSSIIVSLQYVDDAWVGAQPGSEVENRAALALKLEAGTFQQEYATMEIPSADIGIFVAATGASKNIVDTSDTALNTFVDHFKTGGIAKIASNQVVESLESGKRVHKASRRG